MSEMMSMDYEAEQMMTPEQKELSEVRQRHIAESPVIKELPSDFSYTVWASYITGFLGNVIDGTFNGKKVNVERFSFGEGQPWRYNNLIKGDREDPKVQFEELESVTNAFEKMRTEEREVERSHESRRRREEQDRREQAKIDEANRIESLKTQEFNKILDQLGENVKVLDQISKQDKDLLISVLKDLASSRVKWDGEMRLGYSIVIYLGPWSTEREKEDEYERVKTTLEYERVKTTLLGLMGIDSDTKPKKWINPIYGYLHSETHDTILPGVIVRESYYYGETGCDKTGNGNRAVLRIEDNPEKDVIRWAPRSW